MGALSRFRTRFALIVAALVIASLAGLAWRTTSEFDRQLLPEVEQRAATVARSAAALLARPLAHGIALRDLVGVDEVLREIQSENPIFDLLAVSDRAGQVLFAVGTRDVGLDSALARPAPSEPRLVEVGNLYLLSVEIPGPSASSGTLHIGAHLNFVRRLLQDTALDISIVLVVAIFVTLELLHFFARGTVLTRLAEVAHVLDSVRLGDFRARCSEAAVQSLGRLPASLNRCVETANGAYERALSAAHRAWPTRRADRSYLRGLVRRIREARGRYLFAPPPGAQPLPESDRLAVLRAPLFLFFVAEDLSRAFLPLFVAELYEPVPGLSTDLVLGLPIVLFMAIVGLAQPVMGRWSENAGRKRTLMLGMAIAAASHAASAAAPGLLLLLLARCAAGAGWALVFIGAQGHVLDHTDSRTRSHGIAFFVGIIMVASICGPSIGGILGDTIGHRMTLALGAFFGAAAWFLCWRELPPDRPQSRPGGRVRLADFAVLLRSRDFSTLVFAAALPAKVALIGFCFYLVPLYTVELGAGSSMAGRVIMLYSIVMVLGVPHAARWADRLGARPHFVAAGLAISALAGLIPWIAGGLAPLATAILLLGVAQALSIAAQTAMVNDVCRRDIARLGEGTVLGIYRLLERVGNAAGPLVAALVVSLTGYRGAFAVIGALMLACCIVFALRFVWQPGSRSA